MVLAALGDIHANLAALRAVLAEITDAGIRTVVNTGDCVVGAPWPNEVIDCVCEAKLITVQGLMDRYTAAFQKKRARLRKGHPEIFEAIAWTHAHLRSEHLEFLARLPKMRTFTLDGIAVVLCHGTTSSQSDALREDDDVNRFRRQRERACAQLVVCGQTHQPFARWIEDTLFVNPGAVGISSDGSGIASYAVIDTEQAPWQTTFRSVAYVS
jgi:putative phosphoesterase